MAGTRSANNSSLVLHIIPSDLFIYYSRTELFFTLGAFVYQQFCWFVNKHKQRFPTESAMIRGFARHFVTSYLRCLPASAPPFHQFTMRRQHYLARRRLQFMSLYVSSFKRWLASPLYFWCRLRS